MHYESDDPGSFSIRSDDPSLQEQLDRYWDSRSRGYNFATHHILGKTSYYDELIDSLIPSGMSGKVLDIATGCGEMAIVAARKGHSVTAIDTSERMLYHARKNADKENLDITCMRMDMNEVNGFEPRSFDLVIAKSAIWLLRYPVKAIRDWADLIKPGGKMLIIDSNFYLGHFDTDYRRLLEYWEMQKKESSGVYGITNIDRVDTVTIHRLAESLPVCHLRRPGWDVSVLLGLGFCDIKVNCTDKNPYRAMFDAGYLYLPMDFTIVASVPANFEKRSFDGTEFHAKVPMECIEPDPGFIERLKAMGDSNRMRILSILYISDMNVKGISEITGMSMPHVSYNLRVLKDAGLIEGYRSGKEVYYKISDRELFSEYARLKNL